MIAMKSLKIAAALTAAFAISGCGGVNLGQRDPSSNSGSRTIDAEAEALPTTSIWEFFNRGDAESKVAVNKYLWAASIEVLNFLPIQTVDPFTGVIVTGYGTPPNGGRAYRATVLIDDPALDARSLTVALQTRGGAASTATIRAVEDAILSRARQLRIADNKL
jgi:hypothetical protein